MNHPNSPAVIAAGAFLMAAALILNSLGRGAPLASSSAYAASAALILTFVVICVNTYPNVGGGLLAGWMMTW